MEGWIYITGSGVDPGLGHNLSDPTLDDAPTLGACMPNIRRLININDYIFVVSGKNSSAQQYVIGGFCVAEKIPMISAYSRFPSNRLRKEAGVIKGNIIINADGSRHKLDHHNDSPDAFRRRIENYLVGKNGIVMSNEQEIRACREQTLPLLSKVLGKSGKRVIDLTGRSCKLSQKQTQVLLSWLNSIKRIHK